LCGDETIEETTPGPEIFRLAKDQGIVELFSDTALHPLFTVGVRDKCQIEFIEILNPDLTPIDSA